MLSVDRRLVNLCYVLNWMWLTYIHIHIYSLFLSPIEAIIRFVSLTTTVAMETIWRRFWWHFLLNLGDKFPIPLLKFLYAMHLANSRFLEWANILNPVSFLISTFVFWVFLKNCIIESFLLLNLVISLDYFLPGFIWILTHVSLSRDIFTSPNTPTLLPIWDRHP